MDAFNYLSVLLSIIIGLGMTQVLTAIGRIIRQRHAVVFYWVPAVWANLLLLIYVQSWWAMFGLREHRAWQFTDFLIVLLQAVTLYMMAAVVLPETIADDAVDLRAHYRNQRRWFFGFFLATLVVSVAKDLILAGAWPSGMNLGFHAVFAAIALIAIVSRRDRMHESLALLSGAVFATYVAVLFARLR